MPVLNFPQLKKAEQFPENVFEDENFVLTKPLSTEETWAVSCFTGWSGLLINQTLRFSKEEIPILSEDEKKIVDYLQSAFRHSRTSCNMMLYRNVELDLLLDSNNLQLTDLKKGCLLKDNGYMEASPLQLDKMYNNDTLLIINVPEDMPGICVAAYTHREYEMGILFDQGSTLRVDKIKFPAFGKWDCRIYCTLLPN